MAATFELRGAKSAPAAARERCVDLARDLEESGGRPAALPASIERDLRLLVSELTANAVLHGGADPSAPLTVAVEAGEGRVSVSVTDPGEGFTPAAGRDASEGGFGLQLVDRIADCWGVERRDGRTTVWFELEAG